MHISQQEEDLDEIAFAALGLPKQGARRGSDVAAARGTAPPRAVSAAPAVVIGDEKRSCTDVFCFVAFVLSLVALLGFAVVGAVLGQPLDLVLPSDYTGRLCGSGKPLRRTGLVAGGAAEMAELLSRRFDGLGSPAVTAPGSRLVVPADLGVVTGEQRAPLSATVSGKQWLAYYEARPFAAFPFLGGGGVDRGGKFFHFLSLSLFLL